MSLETVIAETVSHYDRSETASAWAVQKAPLQTAIAPIDLKHLGRFTRGDVDLEMEVLGLFVGQMPVLIAALKGARTEKDWYMAAHTLKGSGRAVGAWRLADLALQAEATGPADTSGVVAALVAEIELAALEAAAFIQKLALPCGV